MIHFPQSQKEARQMAVVQAIVQLAETMKTLAQDGIMEMTAEAQAHGGLIAKAVVSTTPFQKPGPHLHNYFQVVTISYDSLYIWHDTYPAPEEDIAKAILARYEEKCNLASLDVENSKLADLEWDFMPMQIDDPLSWAGEGSAGGLKLGNGKISIELVKS
jgi:hypothetical protein